MKASAQLLTLAFLLMLWSCSKSADDNIMPSASDNKTEQVAGEWIVTYYFDNNKDETNNYNGYSFTFTSNGTVTANSVSGSFTGSWRIGNSGSDDDNSSSRFVITISGNKQMDDLTDDWVIVSISDTEISLRDDNPANMEALKFSEKNQ